MRNLSTAVVCSVACCVLLNLSALAQDIGSPQADAIEGLYPGKACSPYARRSFPSQVYWGETHLHTSNLPDASLFGNNLPLEDAWRAARGEEVKSSTGLPFKMGRPLDWLVIADHAKFYDIAVSDGREIGAKQSAFYYVRVLEIPTPRWVVSDKVRLGAEIPEGADLISQERAYTSPIWYTP